MIWVLGGLTNKEATPSVQGYDPAINAWKDAAPLPVPLHHEMATTYSGQIVALGGWQPQGANLTAVIQNTKVFALSGRRWTELPPMLSPRVAGGAVIIGNKIIVAGGQANGTLNPSTEIFDGKAWKRGPRHADPARAPGHGHRRPVRLRDRRAGDVVGQEQRRRRALRPRDRPLGGAGTAAHPARRDRRGVRRRSASSSRAGRPPPR